jgi:glycosyltransferase involved in cell wall biosynthesis
MSRKLPRIQFVAFATAWGSAHGGINSFNRDFCSALAKCLKCGIGCIVPIASVDEKKDASDQGVILLPLGSISPGEFDVGSASAVLKIADFTDVKCWIGHDIITGEFAAAVRDLVGEGCLAVIMHQSYEAYAEVKHSVADSGKALRQKDLFENADKSFAIGPLLHRRLLDWSAKGQLIIPGLNIVEHRPAENALKVVVFGRLTKDNALIKGIELAGHSVAEAIKRARVARSDSIVTEALIKFIGTDPQDTYAKTIKSDIERRAGLPVNVSLIPFVSARELITHIKGANLSLMLSWHEGFGLAAWESIGAGIPLILTQNSGVYELLKDHGGRALGCVKSIEVLGSSTAEPFQESDLEAASTAVLDIARDIKPAILDAEHLRNFLKEVGYTWESSALKFVHALGQESCLKTISERPFSLPSGVERETQSARSREQRNARPNRVAKKKSAMIQESPFILPPLMDMVNAAGLTAFYPSREYYNVFRSVSSIDAYVSTATGSIVMVSVNLMTGIPFHELCEALKKKLEGNSRLTVLISLLDFRKSWLMQTMAPALDLKPVSLANNIIESLEKLWKMKKTLPSPVQERFSIRVHQSIPFGSAIMLDHASANGRIQIETKVPKVALRKSFAFEVGPSGASGFYNMLVSGYLDLISEGQEVEAALLSAASTNLT